MRKVHLGVKTFKLRQSLKLRTVIGRHRLKDLAEAFCAIQLLQLCKSCMAQVRPGMRMAM